MRCCWKQVFMWRQGNNQMVDCANKSWNIKPQSIYGHKNTRNYKNEQILDQAKKQDNLNRTSIVLFALQKYKKLKGGHGQSLETCLFMA